MSNTVIRALLALALVYTCFASIHQEGESSWTFLDIGFQDYANLVESGTYLHWTYDFGGSINSVNVGSCSAVEYSTGYVIVPYSWYLDHKSAVDAGIRDVGSISGHEGSYAHSSSITSLIKNRILGGSSSYAPKELKPWGKASSCETVMNIKAEGSGLDEYLVVGVGCIYAYELWHGERSFCEVATAKTVIYDCGYCGSDVCLLDYLNHNEMWIDGFFNRFGSNQVCIRDGGEHGFCESTEDCKNLVSKPSPTLGDASHSKPYYAVTAVHCEKDDPTDSRIDYVNQFLVGGGKGTCEYGAERPYDCEYLFGSPSSYSLTTKDGGYNSQRSYWAVDGGRCILGECNGFGACYDLYNSIYYDCVSVAVYSEEGLKSTYGLCKQTSWTTAQIQAKCEEVEGAPKSGYAWYVDEDGECFQDKPVESECSKASDCDCKKGENAVCQIIESASGNFGVCKCTESGGGVTPVECGDHICDTAHGETSKNCPEDCGTTTTRPIVIGGGDKTDSSALFVGIIVVLLLIVFIVLIAGLIIKVRGG